MSLFYCVNNIFKEYDYNQCYISEDQFLKNNHSDRAWVKIDNEIFSIQKKDNYLLELFKNYYGKDVKKYILNLNISNKEKIQIYELLKKRKIGNLKK